LKRIRKVILGVVILYTLTYRRRNGGAGWGGEGEFVNQLKATLKLTTVSKFPGMFQKGECCVIFTSNLEQKRKKNFKLVTE